MEEHVVAVSGDVRLLFYSDAPSTTGNPSQGPSVSIRVSSEVLSRASRVFNAMLNNGHMSQSLSLRRGGHVDIPLLEDDGHAFLMIMDIIHENLSGLPATVDLQILSAVTTVVDKYEFHDAVRGQAVNWIDNLSVFTQRSFTSDTISWIWISKVWGYDSMYQHFTGIAQRGSKRRISHASLNPYNVPLPTIIVSKDQSRLRVG